MSGVTKGESKNLGDTAMSVVKFLPGYQMTKLGSDLVQKHTVLPKVLDKLKDFKVGEAVEVLGQNGLKNVRGVFNFVQKSLGLDGR